MTQDEFLSSWAGASADARFENFKDWILARLENVDDLLPAISITKDPAETGLSQQSRSAIVVSAAYFDDATPDRALSAGTAIIDLYRRVAMEEYYKWQKEKEAYEKDYRKTRDKETEKRLKDAKPKGSKAGYGDYLYGKKMKELEYGSG